MSLTHLSLRSPTHPGNGLGSPVSQRMDRKMIPRKDFPLTLIFWRVVIPEEQLLEITAGRTKPLLTTTIIITMATTRHPSCYQPFLTCKLTVPSREGPYHDHLHVSEGETDACRAMKQPHETTSYHEAQFRHFERAQRSIFERKTTVRVNH